MKSFSVYIDFLLSLVFIIALCSTILSIIYEAISYYFKTRNYFLKDALEQVLNDTVHEGKLNLAELFYAHPQIDLTKKTYRHLPAYISSANFAQTLVDSLCNKYERDNTSISSNPLEKAVVNNPVKNTMNKYDVFAKAVDSLGYCDLQILLNSFISNSEGELDKLYKNIVQWYEEYMNRVSGWYKIKVQKNLFVLAIIVCACMNMDFFKICSSLIADKNLSANIAAVAANYQQPVTDSIKDSASLAKAIAAKDSIVNLLYKINAPVFWYNESPRSIGAGGDWGLKWGAKIIGWLLMAVVLSFGSPFWFQVMNRLVSIRKTGVRPAIITTSAGD